MLNKLILRAFLSLSLALSFTSANAALITQDFISDETGNVIGSITINTFPADDWGLSNVYAWEEFEFFGIDMLAPVMADVDKFYASFDAADFSLGIQVLSFDLNDVFGWYSWSGVAYFGEGDVAAYDLAGNTDPEFVGYFTYSLGEASVVPTPATLVLFLTAVAGLAARRKKANR